MAKTITDAALEYLAQHDGNLYADDNNVSLMIGSIEVDVESVWHNKQEHKVYLHVGCKEFEGDIDIESLSDENKWRLLGMFTGKWNRFGAVTEAKELDFYSIEPDGHGGKQIHISGYVYPGDEDYGDGCWRSASCTFCIVPLEEFIDEIYYDPAYATNLMGECQQYIGDCTEEDVVDTINHYFNGKPADYALPYADITMDTPIGNYVCIN